MEWWILTAVVLAGLATGVALRLRRPHRAERKDEPKSIYPLW